MTQTVNIPPANAPACPRCGRSTSNGELVCQGCGQLIHQQKLQELAAQAQQLEAVNPQAAASIWAQCLQFLPPNSPQYASVWNRINHLSSGVTPPAPPRRDNWMTALAKTGLSMIGTIVVYGFFFDRQFGFPYGLWFAAGFVVLMLIHELGHVIAMRHYGIPGSPPIFIPFVGALINLRRNPRNAKEEAIIGIGGPVLGTIGAMACFGVAEALHGSPSLHTVLLAASEWGFILNLFNLLPVPPLDGGRVTAAVSPWIWMLGIIGLVGMIAMDFMAGGGVNPILILILIFAAPRIWRTLQVGGRSGPYYQISRTASVTIGTVYILLGLVLILFVYLTQAYRQFS